MYTRILTESIVEKLFSGEIIMIIGARQVGKTTLLENFLSDKEYESIKFNGDFLDDRELLNSQDKERLLMIIGDKRYIIIDEAQKAKNIGNTLKILVDHFKNTKQIIVTGSSSIHLLDNTSEALTGRKIVYHMYPISFEEISKTYSIQKAEKQIEDLLIFGSYPKVLLENSHIGKKEKLTELTTSSLYKDILEFQNIKNSDVLTKLLKALALQIGGEVSYQELGKIVSIDAKTVEKYIDLLEKSFIIFRLPPYFTNKRKELNKMNKIYFYDLGIRNTLINNFNFLDQRDDKGALRENFVILERMKRRKYHKNTAYQYFRKEYNGKEIDLIEEDNGMIRAYECKLSKESKIPKIFESEYNNIELYTTINRHTITKFLLQ
ncbi:MAG: ATP-binding protein [Candidatus Absconditabacteria bacterium]